MSLFNKKKQLNYLININKKYSLHLFSSFFECNFFFFNKDSNFIKFKNLFILKIFKINKFLNLIVNPILFIKNNFFFFNSLQKLIFFDYKIFFIFYKNNFNQRKNNYNFSNLFFLWLKFIYKLSFNNFSYFFEEVFLTGYFRSIRFWKRKNIVYFKVGKSFFTKIYLPTKITANVFKYRTIRFFSLLKSKISCLCLQIVSFKPASVFNQKGVYITTRKFNIKSNLSKNKSKY